MHILLATWNVDFALVNEREKNSMQEESYKLHALISKLRLVDDEMSIKTYIQNGRERDFELKLSIEELVMLLWESKALILMLIYIQYMWMMFPHLH